MKKSEAIRIIKETIKEGIEDWNGVIQDYYSKEAKNGESVTDNPGKFVEWLRKNYNPPTPRK